MALCTFTILFKVMEDSLPVKKPLYFAHLICLFPVLNIQQNFIFKHHNLHEIISFHKMVWIEAFNKKSFVPGAKFAILFNCIRNYWSFSSLGLPYNFITSFCTSTHRKSKPYVVCTRQYFNLSWRNGESHGLIILKL